MYQRAVCSPQSDAPLRAYDDLLTRQAAVATNQANALMMLFVMYPKLEVTLAADWLNSDEDHILLMVERIDPVLGTRIQVHVTTGMKPLYLTLTDEGYLYLDSLINRDGGDLIRIPAVEPARARSSTTTT
jgi:hypothetical protein